jgi:hypothetical protein
MANARLSRVLFYCCLSRRHKITPSPTTIISDCLLPLLLPRPMPRPPLPVDSTDATQPLPLPLRSSLLAYSASNYCYRCATTINHSLTDGDFNHTTTINYQPSIGVLHALLSRPPKRALPPPSPPRLPPRLPTGLFCPLSVIVVVAAARLVKRLPPAVVYDAEAEEEAEKAEEEVVVVVRVLVVGEELTASGEVADLTMTFCFGVGEASADWYCTCVQEESVVLVTATVLWDEDARCGTSASAKISGSERAKHAVQCTHLCPPLFFSSYGTATSHLPRKPAHPT